MNGYEASAAMRTPEQRSHSRKLSQHYFSHQYNNQPQASVPATPRMLSGSSKQASGKKYMPETPPRNAQQASNHYTQQQTLFSSSQSFNHSNVQSQYGNLNTSGDTANGRTVFSPSDSLRRERANFRNEAEPTMNMGSPLQSRVVSSDKRRDNQSFDKFTNGFDKHQEQNVATKVPIINIVNHFDGKADPQEHQPMTENKGFDFIQAYENEHRNDHTLMPPASLLNQPPPTPDFTEDEGTTQMNDDSKITVVESGKKYKEFHRKAIGDWEFIQSIGSGSMGKVKVAKNVKTQDLCAVKIVTRAVKTFLYKCEKDAKFRNSLTAAEYKERILKENNRDKRTIREGGMGQIFYHPNICRLFHIWALTTHYYMLFEYVQGGQLLDYIIQHGSLKEHRVRKFTRGIASAIKYLHGHNIVHRDLKIENILISDSGDIKIIDFGLSNFYNVNSQLKTFCGSLYFAAPELLKAEPYVGPEVDIWAFGIVMFVLLCGKVPFDNDRSDVLHKLIKEGKVEYPSHLSESVKSLLKRMIIVDRNMRYTIDDIIHHPWMNQGYDYNVLSHIPPRKPLVDIDIQTCEEMVNLAFFDDAVTLKQSLLELINSDEYIELAKRHYQLFGNEYPNAGEDDPLLGFHANISLYHLVDEFYGRKYATRYADGQQQPLERNLETHDATVKTALLPGHIKASQNRFDKHNYSSQAEKYNYNQSSQKENQSSEEFLQESSIPDYKHNIVKQPPKVKQEENRKSNVLREPNYQQGSGVVLLPAAQAAVHSTGVKSQAVQGGDTMAQSQTNHDKFRIGSLFRRFSQSKRKAQNPLEPTVSQSEEKPWTKSHKRTVSEGVTIHQRKPAPAFGNQNFPALPVNADLLVKREQQRYNSVNDGNSEQAYTAATDSFKDSNVVVANNVPNSQSTVDSRGSKRKLHPTARAKSVGGHIAADFTKQTYDTNGTSFDDKTVDQIMKEASLAPKNSMPSIEYPKVFFLKNFFSAQTTSFLPLPVVRYEIIKTLKHMNIEYKEIPGAFVCTHSNQPLQGNLVAKNDTLDDITSAYYDEHDPRTTYQNDTGKHNLSRRGSVMRSAFKEQIPQTPRILSNANHFSSANTPKSPYMGDISLEYDDSYNYDDEHLQREFEAMNLDNQLASKSKSRMMITDDSKPASSNGQENGKVVFEIHIVKIPVIGSAGVHFKKVSGNTWNYKTLASNVLNELNL